MRISTRPAVWMAMAMALVLAFCSSISLAQNPLGRPEAVEQHPFAGVFTGDKIALDLNYDNAQQAYTGWLTFQGKKYACGGIVDNSQLVGKFVADGKPYPFSVGIDGNGITLSSDGQNYPLKRQAAPADGGNPLAGGGGAAPNPLAGGGGGFPAGGGNRPALAPAGNGGVGMKFQPNQDGDLVIVGVMPGGPAEKAGIKAGTYLVEIDGKSTENLPPEKVRDLLSGPIGSKVKLTIDTETDSHDFLVTRGDLSGGNAPQPGPGPGPGPIGPFGPGNQPNNVAGPAWMKPGVRLTFWGGSALIPGVNTVLVPDDNGDWKTPDGRSFKPADNPGGGGMGYQQLTVANVVNGTAIVDARNFLLNPQTQACTSIGAGGYILPVNNGGDYWGDPQQLKQMRAGTNGPVRVFRGPYKLGDKTYDVVRITTKVDGGYTQTTYDTDSGIVLSLGSCTTGAAQMTPGPNGAGGMGDGNTHMVQCFFVGMRQTELPWTGQRATPDLAQLKQLDFAGSYSTAVQMAGTITWPYTSHWDIGKLDEFSVQMKQTFAIDYRNGQPPQPQTSDRAGSLTCVWVDPRILGKLQQGQVIDEDPITKMKLSVAGVQNGSVVFVERSQVETTSVAYDQRSGQISGIQMQQQNGPGTTTITLQRTK